MNKWLIAALFVAPVPPLVAFCLQTTHNVEAVQALAKKSAGSQDLAEEIDRIIAGDDMTAPEIGEPMPVALAKVLAYIKALKARQGGPHYLQCRPDHE